MRRLLGLVGAPAMLLAFAACKEDTGYVEIKVAPGFVVPPLVLGASRVDTTKSGRVGFVSEFHRIRQPAAAANKRDAGAGTPA